MQLYLDNNATTKPDKSVVQLALDMASDYFGNPSSTHEEGYRSKDLLERSRNTVAKAIGAKSSEIVFTSGGTEANNLALQKERVFCSAVEHNSVFQNKPEEILPVLSDGTLDFGYLEQKLRDKKLLDFDIVVSVMMANNETGVILDPNNDLRKLKEKYGFVLHIDAVQSLGKMPISVKDCGADLLSISAHKCYGPKGIGALYINKDLPAKPTSLFVGGSHERGYRPGTENIFGAVALAEVCERYCDRRQLGVLSSRLRNKLETGLYDIAQVNGNKEHRVYNTSNLYFPDVEDVDIFLERLSINGVYASGKSACSSGMPTPSRVISSMFDTKRANSSVRFSLSRNTREWEIDAAVTIIRKTVSEVKNGY